MPACPSDDELSQYAERRAPPATRERIQAHLADCEACTALVSLLVRAAPEPPPEPPGRYELKSQVGSGAMGSVFIAYDRVLQRQVALKWLMTDARTATPARERLLSEAMALAKVNHPNVVHVYDVLTLDGDDVMSMELVTGATLREWLAAEPRPVAAVLDAFRQAARGLAAVHAVGLVHRDFKPSNAVVGADGVLRLVDFGLSFDTGQASALLPNADALATRTSRGTPRYMSPEVLRGTAADARSDQYSWAVALFEALVGEPPFPSESTAEKLEVMEAHGFVAHSRFAKLPRAVRAVLRRALSFQRGDRYASMDEAAAALAPRARRSSLWLGVAAGIAVAVAGVGRWWTTRCDDAAAALDGVWSDARRAAVGKAIEAAGGAQGVGIRTQALALVDRWAAAWRGERRALCEASWRGSAPQAVVALQFACTERVAAVMSAQLTALDTLDAAAAGKVVSALSLVPEPLTCRNVGDLMAVDPQPPNPLIADVEARLAQGLAEVGLGRHEGAQQRCTQLMKDADGVGWRPLQARVARFCAFVQVRLTRSDPSGLFPKALALALAGNDTLTAIQALGGLIFLSGEVPRSGAVAAEDAWMAVADGLAQRHGLDLSPAFCATLRNRAQVAYERRDHAATERYAARAVELQTKAGTPTSDCALGARSTRAQGLAGLGRFTEALAEVDTVLRATGALDGQITQLAFTVFSTKIVIGSMMHDEPAAYAAAQQMLAMAEKGAPAATLALSHQNVAERALMVNELARARAELELVGQSNLVVPGGSLYSWFLLFTGELALAEGRAADAQRAFADVVARQKALDLDEVDVATAQWGLAQAEHALKPNLPALLAAARRLAPALAGNHAYAAQQLRRWLPDAGTP